LRGRGGESRRMREGWRGRASGRRRWRYRTRMRHVPSPLQPAPPSSHSPLRHPPRSSPLCLFYLLPCLRCLPCAPPPPARLPPPPPPSPAPPCLQPPPRCQSISTYRRRVTQVLQNLTTVPPAAEHPHSSPSAAATRLALAKTYVEGQLEILDDVAGGSHSPQLQLRACRVLKPKHQS